MRWEPMSIASKSAVFFHSCHASRASRPSSNAARRTSFCRGVGQHPDSLPTPKRASRSIATVMVSRPFAGRASPVQRRLQHTRIVVPGIALADAKIGIMDATPQQQLPQDLRTAAQVYGSRIPINKFADAAVRPEQAHTKNSLPPDEHGTREAPWQERRSVAGLLSDATVPLWSMAELSDMAEHHVECWIISQNCGLKLQLIFHPAVVGI